MATLVTGGTGFVGSNIVKTLAENGHEVVCFDLAAPDHLVEAYVAPWTDQVRFVQGNILSRDDLQKLLDSDITRVVHAAVFTGVLPEVEAGRSRSIVEINLMGTTNLLELARDLQVRRFLYVSSVSAYGEITGVDGLLSEELPVNPRSLYALTKYAGELLTRRYGDLFGFQTVSTRLDGPYGPMERVTSHRENQSLIKDWTGRAIRDEAIDVYDPGQELEITYVVDIAQGIATVLDAQHLSHQVYNVSCGISYTQEEILRVLNKLVPDLQVLVNASEQPSEESRGYGRPNMDVSRLREDLGFQCRYDLESGLQEYLDWRRAYDFTE